MNHWTLSFSERKKYTVLGTAPIFPADKAYRIYYVYYHFQVVVNLGVFIASDLHQDEVCKASCIGVLVAEQDGLGMRHVEIVKYRKVFHPLGSGHLLC